MSNLNDFQLTDNFNLKEYESPDTKEVKIDRRLVEVCQKLRDEIGCKLTVTRGYSTPAHNAKVGGAKKSRHKEGLAADLQPEDMALLLRLFELAAGIPEIKGLGLYETHVHIDVRRWDRRVIWVKLKKNKHKYFSDPTLALRFFSSST